MFLEKPGLKCWFFEKIKGLLGFVNKKNILMSLPWTQQVYCFKQCTHQYVTKSQLPLQVYVGRLWAKNGQTCAEYTRRHWKLVVLMNLEPFCHSYVITVCNLHWPCKYLIIHTHNNWTVYFPGGRTSRKETARHTYSTFMMWPLQSITLHQPGQPEDLQHQYRSTPMHEIPWLRYT